MTLGSVFLRPQSLNRAVTSDEAHLLDAFFELASRLTRDALRGGPARQKIDGVLQACADELAQEMQARVGSAAGNIQAWFAPIVASIQAKAGSIGSSQGPDGAVAAAAVMIGLLAEALESLSSDQLAQKLNELGDIVENDLGLTPARLTAFAKQCADRAVDELTADYLAGQQTAAARDNFLIGSQLASLKLFMLQQAPILAFDRWKLIDELAAALKKKNWDTQRQKISSLAAHASAGVRNLSPLFAFSGSAGVGATDDPDPMSWYASWFRGQVTMVADRFELNHETFFDQMSFTDALSPEFMEHWAYLTSGLCDIAEAVLHGVSIEKNDILSNLFNLILQGGKGIFTLAAYGHEGGDWEDVFKLVDNWWLEYGVAFVVTTLCSLENHPDSFLAWLLAFFAPDLVEMLLYAGWTYQVRDSSLSLFTLINARDPGGHPNSQNHEKVEGLALAFAEIGSWLAALYPVEIKGKRHYGIPHKSERGEWAGFLTLYWVLGLVFGFGLATIGWLVGWAIAGKHSSTETFGILAGKSLLLSLLKWPVYWFLTWNGDTDDGTLGLGRDPTDPRKDILVTFGGYPEATQSPYKLPYKSGEAIQCVQGNQGLWSHNINTDEIYAVDFAFNHGTEVLAMRGGTVASYRDTIPNHSGETDNNIVIRHDDPDEGPLPNPAHDRDDKKDAVTTWAHYLHGQHFGVRHAFATRGIPEKNPLNGKNYIKGAKIKQGTLIMYSGDTGVSAYNHLHVMVENQAGNTVPFVFRDVRNRLGRDGVPKAFNSYVSDNARSGEIRPIALYQPDYHEGIAKGGGADYIDLDDHASRADDEYKGAHIFVVSNVGGVDVYQYKKIVRYQGGDDKRATIDGTWEVNPAVNASFRIGAPPYASANNFNKIFGYLANRNDAGDATPFEDGRAPDTYALIGAYHPAAHQGTVQAGGTPGGDFIVLENSASPDDRAYNDRHLVVRRGGDPIQYKRVKGYEGATRKATIDGSWDQALATGAGADQYFIGGPPYAGAGDEDKRYAYLAADDPAETNAPANFADGRKPYVYLTFKMNW